MKDWIKNRLSERSTKMAIVGLISSAVVWKTHDAELAAMVSSALFIVIGITPDDSK